MKVATKTRSGRRASQGEVLSQDELSHSMTQIRLMGPEYSDGAVIKDEVRETGRNKDNVWM